MKLWWLFGATLFIGLTLIMASPFIGSDIHTTLIKIDTDTQYQAIVTEYQPDIKFVSLRETPWDKVYILKVSTHYVLGDMRSGEVILNWSGSKTMRREENETPTTIYNKQQIVYSS